MKNDSIWQNDAIQFPRLISEAAAAGAFTPAIMRDMAKSMDLPLSRVRELIERADFTFEQVKQGLD